MKYGVVRRTRFEKECFLQIFVFENDEAVCIHKTCLQKGNFFDKKNLTTIQIGSNICYLRNSENLIEVMRYDLCAREETVVITLEVE